MIKKISNIIISILVTFVLLTLLDIPNKCIIGKTDYQKDINNKKDNNKKNKIEDNNKEEKEEQETQAEDNSQLESFQNNEDQIVNKKTIVIDPGHSSNPKSDNEPLYEGSTNMKVMDTIGACGINGIYEYSINNDVAKLLKNDLESRGFNVVLTKDNVETDLSNIERAEIGNDNNADLVIRIHCDSFDDSSANGASMLVPANNSITGNIYNSSRKYGEIILNSYTNKVPIKNRGIVETSEMTGFNWSKVPIVLIELGFLSNQGDDSYISNSNNYQLMVSGIGEGIEKCFW